MGNSYSEFGEKNMVEVSGVTGFNHMFGIFTRNSYLFFFFVLRDPCEGVNFICNPYHGIEIFTTNIEAALTSLIAKIVYDLIIKAVIPGKIAYSIILKPLNLLLALYIWWVNCVQQRQ